MRIVLLIALLPLLSVPALGQAVDASRPESFARPFVEAINSGNVERRLGLLHPNSRACITPQTRPFFDWVFSRQTVKTVPADYRVTAEPFAKTPGPLAAPSTYPAQPTHTLQIDYRTGPNADAAFVLTIAHDGERWREILPCPSQEAIQGAQRSVAARLQQDAHAQTVVDGLAAPFRAEVLVLIRAGRRVDAIRTPVPSAGGDLTVARSAVDLLTATIQK